MMNGCNMLDGAEFYVAIDNKGLWPNLTLLPGGGIGAAVYNHPSHGYGTGSDVELWVSPDGRFWEYRSTVSDRGDNPNGIRMNHAVGVNAKGELIAFVSGYQENQKLPFLPLQLCVSKDDGHEWERSTPDIDLHAFGDILCLPDGELLAAMIKRTGQKPNKSDSTLWHSLNHGRTWREKSTICKDGNETHLLYCRNGDVLAAVRTCCMDANDRMDSMLPHGKGERLFRSADGGKTWSTGKPISPQGQENAHLLQLQDDRLLCCFTSRIPGLFGVVFRLSEDNGETWSRSKTLVTIPAIDWHLTDAGYPSSVQLEDGTIVTAYYFGPKKPEYARHAPPWHQRYHMGVARYTADCLAL